MENYLQISYSYLIKKNNLIIRLILDFSTNYSIDKQENRYETTEIKTHKKTKIDDFTSLYTNVHQLKVSFFISAGHILQENDSGLTISAGIKRKDIESIAKSGARKVGSLAGYFFNQ